ncbi:hypothetical protein ACIA5G_52050 [Amycolatopsis sp. NPDC051758]|uniref:hypothetical protein n=1 Tax=Amycolatopsis sp. NPDC051758 TaxID=3363935 RepID=UPI0037AC8CE1
MIDVTTTAIVVAATGGGAETMCGAAERLSTTLTDREEYRTDGLLLAVAALPRQGDLLPTVPRIAALASRPALAWQVADRLATWLGGHDSDRPGLLGTALALTDRPGGGVAGSEYREQGRPPCRMAASVARAGIGAARPPRRRRLRTRVAHLYRSRVMCQAQAP